MPALAWLLKAEAVRPKTPLNLDDARRVVGAFVEEYNNQAPAQHDRLRHSPRPARGRHVQIWEERDRKLEAARARRAAAREEGRQQETTAEMAVAVGHFDHDRNSSSR